MLCPVGLPCSNAKETRSRLAHARRTTPLLLGYDDAIAWREIAVSDFGIRIVIESDRYRDLDRQSNTRVTKGQPCATIDPRPYQTVVDQPTWIVVTGFTVPLPVTVRAIVPRETSLVA